MKWVSAISQAAATAEAIADVATQVRREMAGLEVNCLFVFTSVHHRKHYFEIPRLFCDLFETSKVLGSSCGGVLGGDCEVEDSPAISVLAGHLPNVVLNAFHIEQVDVPRDDEPVEEWVGTVDASPEDNSAFILIPDPYSFDPTGLLEGLDRMFPQSTKVGGLASGATAPGGNALFVDRHCFRSGLVGLSLSGQIAVDTIVAQGCRPIGVPMFATGCDRNLIFTLDGKEPSDIIEELFKSASPSDRRLFRDSLFLGVVMARGQESYNQGDFLIRNILGLKRDVGALYLGATVEANQVVQFHLRDAKTSDEDLKGHLTRYRDGHRSLPSAALLFSCVGRGENLYGEPDHETKAVREFLGEVPVGGFFCGGEIGAVGKQTFLHGYTSAFALFRDVIDGADD